MVCCTNWFGRKQKTNFKCEFQSFPSLDSPNSTAAAAASATRFCSRFYFFFFFSSADWLRNTHVRNKNQFPYVATIYAPFRSCICLDNRAARARTGSRLIRWLTVSTESLQQFAEKQRTKKCIICSLRCFSSLVLCSRRPNGSRSKRENEEKKDNNNNNTVEVFKCCNAAARRENGLSGLPIRTHASTRAASSRL